MRDGTWTIEPCAYADVKRLAEELELSEVTASVLVRRGYADVERARAFVVGELEPHDPLLLGDMAVAVEKIRAAIAAAGLHVDGCLGGFILPLLFGVLNDVTGIWSSCFAAIFVLVAVSLLWMHSAVRQIDRQPAGEPA